MSNQPELFRNHPNAHFSETQGMYSSGFDVLSTYTLQEMPEDLRAVREGGLTYDELSKKQHAVIEASSMTALSNRNPEAAQEAQLDMLFMLGGYLPDGKTSFNKAPSSLHGMLDYNANRFDLPRRMDYELIVDVNTDLYQRTGNIRLFGDGVEGNAERDFYIGHYYAEPHVKMAAFSLRALLDHPEAADKTEALTSGRDHLKAFASTVRKYGRLAHFGHFRPYLTTYPDGTRNASGAFMPSPQLVELALHKPTPQYELFLEEATPYYPKWAQPLIEQWSSGSRGGNNIHDAIIDGRLKLDDGQVGLLGGLVTELYNFKQAHMGVTFRQLGDTGAFPAEPENRFLTKEQLKDFGERNIFESTQVRGTGGFDVQNILGNGVYRLIKLIEGLSPEAIAKKRDAESE